MGRITLDGTHVQFRNPTVGNQALHMYERLHQVGDIIHLFFRAINRNSPPISKIQLMESRSQVAIAEAPAGSRLFEIFSTHHWFGRFYSEDGSILLPDLQLFGEQTIHLDDPTMNQEEAEKNQTDMIEVISPTEEIEYEEKNIGSQTGAPKNQRTNCSNLQTLRCR